MKITTAKRMPLPSIRTNAEVFPGNFETGIRHSSAQLNWSAPSIPHPEMAKATRPVISRKSRL